MSSDEMLNKIRGIFALWRDHRYEQLAALSSSILIAILVYTSNVNEIPIIGHRAIIAPAVLAATIFCLAFLIWRMKKLAFASPDVLPEKILSNAVRGPLPFVETDGDFFLQLGRTRELQNIMTHVSGNEMPLIVVSGESGAGKTSLLRAGLTYVLKNQYNRTCLYWDAHPKDPEASLLGTLQAAFGGSEKLQTLGAFYESEIPESGLVIILDQFEQLNPEDTEHQAIFDLLYKAFLIHPAHPVTWIIAFKREYGAEWFEFQSSRGIIPAHVPIKLFSEEQAERVMIALGAAAGVTFERLLLKDFIQSASVLERISPVDIGIGVLVLVGLAEMTNTDILRLGDYNFAGGARGVLTAYLQDRLSTYPDFWRQQILKLLLELFDHNKDQRIAEGLTATTLSQKCNFPLTRINNVLNELANQNVRILEKLEVNNEIHFRIAHERLIPAIRQLSGVILAEDDRARIMLETAYITWSRSRSTNHLLSRQDLRFIRKHQLIRDDALSPEISTYLKLSLRYKRLRLLAACSVIAGAIALLLPFSLKSDWQVSQVATISPTGELRSFSMLPVVDGNMLLTGVASNSEVRIWDIHTARVLLKIPGEEFLLSSNKRYLLVRNNKERTIDMFDINTGTRQHTPFNYQTKLNDIHFDDTGESIFLVTTAPILPPSLGTAAINAHMESDASAINYMKIWSFISGRESTFKLFSKTPISPQNIFLTKTKRLIGIVSDGNVSMPGVWDTESQQFLGYLQHYGNATSAFSVHGQFSVVLEKYNDNQTAIELWDLQTAKLIHERLIAVRPHTLLAATPEFGRDGNIIYISDFASSFDQQSDRLASRPWAKIFKTEDLSEIKNIGIEDAPIKIADHFIIWPTSSTTVRAFDFNKEFSILLPDVKFEDLKNLIASSDLESMILLTKKGEVRICKINTAKPYCRSISNNASSIFRIQGINMFGILTNVGSLSIFRFNGEQKQFLPTTGTFGDKFLLSTSLEYNEIFSWTEDGQVLRYNKHWTLFGIGIQ